MARSRRPWSAAAARGGRVAFLSHCLLNENVRSPGGVTCSGAIPALLTGSIADGVGIYQMPCQRALGATSSRTDTAGVEVVPTAVPGSAAGAIVDAGEHADLVVGSRGLGTRDRLMLASVATLVALHARGAVAVVPGAGANDTDLPDTSNARSSS